MNGCLQGKIQSDGIIEKLKLRILLSKDLQNKEAIGDTWFPTEWISTIKYLSVDNNKNKARVNKLDLIGAFLQCNLKHRVLWSWASDMENNFQNIETILEYY